MPVSVRLGYTGQKNAGRTKKERPFGRYMRAQSALFWPHVRLFLSLLDFVRRKPGLSDQLDLIGAEPAVDLQQVGKDLRRAHELAVPGFGQVVRVGHEILDGVQTE